jgi:hypothetical protein
MESVWEEKKIRALFSDLKTADELSAPRFAAIWNRAQLAPRRTRAFNPAFVVATGLLVCALVLLAVWSRYSQRSQEVNVVVTTSPPAPVIAPTEGIPYSARDLSPRVVPDEVRMRSRRIKTAARRHAQLVAANRKLVREAKSITDWKSPTTELLSSSSDEIFNSLPQLNESANELKSFLPSRPN